MRQKTGPQTSAAEKTIKDIRRATRKHHSSEDKIRIVLEGLRGERKHCHNLPTRRHSESPYYYHLVEGIPRGPGKQAAWPGTLRPSRRPAPEVKVLRSVNRPRLEGGRWPT